MRNCSKFYIDGHWVVPIDPTEKDVVNPATEETVARISIGNAGDVDRAVSAAKAAFPSYSTLNLSDRIDLLRTLEREYMFRVDEFAHRMCLEIGAPITYSRDVQAALAPLHISSAIEAAATFEFSKRHGTSLVVKEPIGVCGLITPWNFPINTVISKLVPALLVGCCVVLKPSELSPLSALLLAETIHAAGYPKGTFNLINGEGSGVGEALAAHPDVAMISITGSVAAGVRVSIAAADSVKRVHQELGGKSANILLPDADLERFVPLSVAACFRNSGQSCSAPTRLLAHRDQLERVEQIAGAAADSIKVGPPSDPATRLGPVVSQIQYDRIQRLIQSGIEEGGKLIVGGMGRPEGITRGFFVRPTIFSEVSPAMTIAQQEIFGPVLSILPYRDEAEAIAIANGTPYGLAAYIESADIDRARRIAARMHAGTVHINFPPHDTRVAFGGYKRSGNGREYGAYGMEEFLELKSITGFYQIDETA